MAFDKRVYDDEGLDKVDPDLAAAARAAASLTGPSEVIARTNSITRALASQLGGDVHRLRRCVGACHRQAEMATDTAVRSLWRRAERLACNALTLMEALGARDTPNPVHQDPGQP
jgi:hypothetical protein